MATQLTHSTTTPTTIMELCDYSLGNPNKLIVIDFNAPWCGPCKAIKPFVDYLKENYPNVDFHEISIEDEERESMISGFDIQKVPTFLYYKKGEVCGKLIGTNKSEIEELINDNL